MAGFQVMKRLSKRVVAAVLPPQEHRRLQQSNLDLLLSAKLDMNIFFCYRKPAGNCPEFRSLVNVVKESLSQTLGPYYTLAGELGRNTSGEPEIVCNNRGVEFTEAYADVELRELDLYKPEESIQGKLVPTLEDGLLAVQVTELSCGGVVVGCTYDHRVADGYSANMFCKSWAEMARSKPLFFIPSFHRSLLSPRLPKMFDPSITDLYVPVSQIQASETLTMLPMISRIYSIPAEKMHNLQTLANHENPGSLIRKRTKLEALGAFLWKLIAQGTNSGESFCKMGILVDGRMRIGPNQEMSNYFGNVVSFPFGKIKNKELKEMPLSSTANEIHRFLDLAAKKDHFLGLIDYVEDHRPEVVVSKIFLSRNQDPNLLVSSVRGFSLQEMDFGWGIPIFGSNLSPPGMPSGFVIIMPSLSENGDWVVYMRIPEHQIELIENGASHLVRPFTLC